MTQMPWDRFGPEEELPYVQPRPLPPVEEPVYPHPPAPPEKPVEDLIERVEPTPPRNPQGPQPEPPEDFNLVQLANDAFQAALNEALPGLKQNAMDYLRASVQATVKGEKVDWSHPSVVAVTDKGKDLVVADAKSRSWRTLVQGLIFDVFAAVVAAVALLSGADPFVRETWIAFGVLLTKSVVSAVISYFMRLKVTPTMKNDEGEKVNVLPLPSPIPVKEDRAA